MRYPRIAPLLLLAALPACPSSSDGNPPVLWLALDGDELHVKLVESEPRPY
jgi:hypothetical protein